MVTEFEKKIILRAREVAPKEGFQDETLMRICMDLGYGKNVYKFVFPDGLLGVCRAFISYSSDMALSKVKDFPLGRLSFKDNLYHVLKYQFYEYKNYKNFVKTTYNFLWNKENAAKSKEIFDDIDNNFLAKLGINPKLDINYVAKKYVLSASVSATMTHWLSREENNIESGLRFLKGKINDLVKMYLDICGIDIA